ncbi:hypothetical protein BpHYR1_007780 [Brachionus plicatilis]|uniref:Uncharacterized protein n=1 Tax=Brachionus plicatilis TaxID=10195 RepID=A0A3M7SYL3_BRAPC|nr:hypothetical protein BpHYR1_007780 [Brachionus plicatilis]
MLEKTKPTKRKSFEKQKEIDLYDCIKMVTKAWKMADFKNKESIDTNFESKKYEDEEKVEIEKLWKHFQQFRFIPTDVSFQDYVEIDNQLAR